MLRDCECRHDFGKRGVGGSYQGSFFRDGDLGAMHRVGV